MFINMCHDVGLFSIKQCVFINTSKKMFLGLFNNFVSTTKFHRVEQDNGHERKIGSNMEYSNLRLF